MIPEREFVLLALSRYLDSSPEQAKANAIDLCTKYLEQQEKVLRLQEHCQLLEKKIEEMNLDYQISTAELEEQRQKNVPRSNTTFKNIQLPNFLSDNSR